MDQWRLSGERCGVRLTAEADHSQEPLPAGAFVVMRFQQNSAVVVDEVAKRRVEALRGPIRELRTIVRGETGHLIEVVANISDAATRDPGIREDLDELLQGADLILVE